MELAQQREHRGPGLRGVAGRGGGHRRGGHILRLLDLEDHGHLSPRQAACRQAFAEHDRAATGSLEQRLHLGDGRVEHETLAPGLLSGCGIDPIAVLTLQQQVNRQPFTAELPLQLRRGQAGDGTEAVEPEPRQAGGDRGIHGEHVEGERSQKRRLLPVPDAADVTRPALAGGKAGDEARPGDAHRRRLDVERHRERPSHRHAPGALIAKSGVAAGEVAERLVVAHLHRRGEAMQGGADLATQGRRRLDVERDEGGGGTELLRLPQGHALTHARRHRRCGRRDHGQAQLRRAADDDRLPAQLRKAAQHGDQSKVGVARTEDAHLNPAPPPPWAAPPRCPPWAVASPRWVAPRPRRRRRAGDSGAAPSPRRSACAHCSSP